MPFTANTTFSCYARSANTGKPQCDINFGAWKGHFLAPIDDGLTQAEVDAFLTTAQARCIANSITARWQIVGAYENIEDKSDDPTESELGNFKNKAITDEGNYGYEVGILDGGVEHLLDLRTYNNKTATYGIIQFDEYGNVAMRYEPSDGKYYPMKMSQYFWKIPKVKVPGAPLLYMGMIRLSPGLQLTSNMRAIQTSVDLIEEIEGVNDVLLTDVSTGLSAGIFDVTAHDHSVNLGNTIGSTAAATTVFKAKLKTTGAALTLTSVGTTTVNGAPAYKVTFNTGGSGYASGAKAIIYWADISTLAGISDSLKYFETHNPNFSSLQLEVTLT